jgi:hypothetical protein
MPQTGSGRSTKWRCRRRREKRSRTGEPRWKWYGVLFGKVPPPDSSIMRYNVRSVEKILKMSNFSSHGNPPVEVRWQPI